MVGLTSSIPPIPECLQTRSFARSKQDESNRFVDKARSVLDLRARVVLVPKGAYALHSLSTKRALEDSG